MGGFILFLVANIFWDAVLEKLISPPMALTAIIVVSALVFSVVKKLLNSKPGDLDVTTQKSGQEVKGMSSKGVKGYVWICSAHRNLNAIQPWSAFDLGPGELPSKEKLVLFDRIMDGEMTCADEHEAKLYLDPHYAEIGQFSSARKMEYISAGYRLIAENSVEILKQFDLGHSEFYPVELYNSDRLEKLDKRFFSFNFSNKKNALIPERSTGLKKLYNPKRDIWRIRSTIKNDEVVFSEAALGGPDIWMDDRLDRSFLVSDRLAKALKEAGLSKGWYLYRCPVVEG